MNANAQPLHDCLKQELDLTTQFLSALQAEANALANENSAQDLTACTNIKSQLAELLIQTGQTRENLLVKLGYSPDKSGLDGVVGAHPELQDICRELLDYATQASKLNTSNGVVINTYLTHNQETLDALLRLTGSGNLYDASGRTKNRPGNTKASIKAG